MGRRGGGSIGGERDRAKEVINEASICCVWPDELRASIKRCQAKNTANKFSMALMLKQCCRRESLPRCFFDLTSQKKQKKKS